MFQADAGDWDPIITAVLAEYEESEYYPDHPEEHSSLYQKMVVLARSAELHGRFTHARTLFEAAGAWRELLALCLFQGDFESLQRYGSRGGRRAELIASHLLAVNEDAFRRSVANNNPKFGGRAFVDDFVPGKGSVAGGDDRPPTPDGPVDFLANAHNVEPAPSDRLPLMQATLQLDENSLATGRVDVVSKPSKPDQPPEDNQESSDDEGDAEPIARIDRTKLASFLGVAGASIKPGSVLSDKLAAESDDEQDGENELEDIDFDHFEDEDDSALGAVQRVITAISPGSASDTATETSAGESVSTRDVIIKKRREQEEARAAFLASKKLVDDEFYSSDDDSSIAGGTGGQLAASSFAAMTSSRLIFRIKSQEEAEAEKGAATSADSMDSLKTAVQNLKLEPVRDATQQAPRSVGEARQAGPSTVASAPIPEDLFTDKAQPMKPPEPPAVPQSDLLSGWDAFEAMFVEPQEESRDSALPENNEVSDPGVIDRGAPSTQPSDPFTVPDAARQQYIAGMAYFNVAGSSAPAWKKASRELSKAFAASSPQDDVFRRRCANEYAAASLMQLASKSRKSAAAARLARFAAALDTDTNMQLATQLAAAEMNIKAGNHRWSSEILRTIVLEFEEEGIEDSHARRLLLSCEGGAEDRSIPHGEDVNSTRMIIEVSGTLQELNGIIAELESGS
jgi:hypothetical protein